VFSTIAVNHALSKIIALLQVAMSQLSGPSVAWCGFILCLLILGIVITPAVWSRRPARRKAAAEVLGQLVRLFRRRS
jgi:hypothetical protein